MDSNWLTGHYLPGVFVYILAFLVPISDTQFIAASSEVLVSVFAGETPLLEYLGHLLLPPTLGNIIRGEVLVTLLNYGRVVGSKESSPAGS